MPRDLAVLAATLLIPVAAHAQRDTIRLGGSSEPRDTIHLSAPEDTAPAEPARPGRWSQPFAVEGSGEVAARPAAREAVWLPADSVRARRIAARRDTASVDTTQLAATDSAADEAEPVDSAPPPPRRSTRTASRDTASTPRRATRTTRSDTTTTTRRTASTDNEDSVAPRPTRRTTTSRDTATSTRRTASRDTAATRRTTSRDTAATRRTTTAANRARTHTVASGETLFGLARRYGVTTAQIRALNPDLGETLETGTVLRLPAGARTPAQREGDDDDRPTARRAAAADSDADRPARRPSTNSGDTDRPAARPAAGRTRRHTVAAGETLYGIARRYGVTVDAIRRANRLEGDTVRPGQALVIPAAPASAPRG